MLATKERRMISTQIIMAGVAAKMMQCLVAWSSISRAIWLLVSVVSIGGCCLIVVGYSVKC